MQGMMRTALGGRAAAMAAVVAALLAGPGGRAQAQSRGDITRLDLTQTDIGLNVISDRALAVSPRELGGVVQRGAAGDIYFLSVESNVVHRVSADGLLTRIRLETTPEAATATVNLMQDLAIDSAGDILVPAIWNLRPKGGAAGILVFDATGRYLRTVPLLTRTNVRHIAVDNSGDFFVLGIDPAYFRGNTDACLLLHKYSADGARITAFSPYSEVSAMAGRPLSGSAWERLNFEVDRGSLWIAGKRLYQLLPASHKLRVFETATGRWTAEIALDPPGGAAPVEAAFSGDNPVVWRVLPLANGRFLTQWGLRPSAAPPARFARFSVHDAHGRALGRADSPALRGAVPIVAADDGTVTFMAAQPNGNVRLLRAELSSR